MAEHSKKVSVETQTHPSDIQKRHEWRIQFVRSFLEEANAEEKLKRVIATPIMPHPERLLNNKYDFKREHMRDSIFEYLNRRLPGGCESISKKIGDVEQHKLQYTEKPQLQNEFLMSNKKQLDPEPKKQLSTTKSSMQVPGKVGTAATELFLKCPCCRQSIHSNNNRRLIHVEQQIIEMRRQLKDVESKLKGDHKIKDLYKKIPKLCISVSENDIHMSSICTDSSNSWEITRNKKDDTNWNDIVFKKVPPYDNVSSKTLSSESKEKLSSSDIQNLPSGSSSNTLMPNNHKHKNRKNEKHKYVTSKSTLEHVPDSPRLDIGTQTRNEDYISTNYPFRSFTFSSKPFQ